MEKIISVELKDGGWGSPVKVIATFESGNVEKVFEYFSDELSFSESELIGLTKEQAQALHYKKDVAYLRS